MQKTIKLSLISIALLSQLNAKEVVALQDVTVTTATKSSQSIKDLTANVDVITSQEIEQKHFTTLTQALNSVAGINYTSNGGIGSTTSIYLRGAGNNRTLILIDGVRYQDPSNTNGASIGHLMINDIERIEIIKGAQSGIWGADASAGVINIITKKAKKGVHVSAKLEAGSFNTKIIGASASYKASKFDVKLSANQVLTDSFSVQAPRNTDIDLYEKDAYENLTLGFEANYYINKDATLGFNINSIQATKDYDSYANPDDDTLKSDIDNKLYTIYYKQKLDTHKMTLKAEQSDFEREEIGTLFGVQNFNGTHTNVEFIDNFSYFEKDFITFGVGTNSDDVDYVEVGGATNNKTNKDNYAYITNSNHFGAIIFTQSLRYDNYDNFDSKATGKLGLKYNLSDELYLSSNVGTGYNVPSIIQELNPWGGTNTELNPENTLTSDFSFGYKGFKATYFYNEITDLIEWYDADGWAGPIQGIYKNLDGKSTLKGFEFEYKQDIADILFASLSYSILSAQDKDEKDLARRPKNTAKINLDYYPLEELHIGAAAEYIGERYDSADKGGAQTGKYTVVDLVSSYDINDNFSVFAKVDNLFDKYYQVVDGYASAPRSGYIGLNAKY